MHRVDNTVPNTSLPVMERVTSDFDISSESGLRITWLGHSTLLVEMEGRRLLVDPVLSERPSPFSWMGPKRFHKTPLIIDELPTIDAVVISHDHYDHLDEKTIKRLGNKPAYLVPQGVGRILKRLKIDCIKELQWHNSVTSNGITFICTPS